MNNIKKLREKAGLTQEEAAARLGIDRSVLSKIENGKYELNSIVLFKMAKYYNTSADKILGIKFTENEMNFAFRNFKYLDDESKRVLLKIEKIVKNMAFLESVDIEKN